MNILKNLFSQVESAKQDTNALVQEIHDAFNGEGERLLKAAKDIIGKPVDEHEEELAQVLKSYGFGLVPIVKKLNEDIEKKQMSWELVELINQYMFFYPQNRFIDESGVTRICQKYGLVCGEVGRYIGNVPAENVREIARFKLRDEDICYRSGGFGTPGRMISKSYYDDLMKLDHRRARYASSSSFFTSIAYAPSMDTNLRICAPQKDFEMTGATVVNHKIVKTPVPDPVVLMPCCGGYLIVTAWGIESKDDGVQNSRHN